MEFNPLGDSQELYNLMHIISHALAYIFFFFFGHTVQLAGS